MWRNVKDKMTKHKVQMNNLVSSFWPINSTWHVSLVSVAWTTIMLSYNEVYGCPFFKWLDKEIGYQNSSPSKRIHFPPTYRILHSAQLRKNERYQGAVSIWRRSFQVWYFHFQDKTVFRSSNFYCTNLYTGKRTSLYQDGPRVNCVSMA